MLTENIAGAAVSNITATNTFVGETPMIAVDVQADLPLLGLYGPTTMTMTGHAYAE